MSKEKEVTIVFNNFTRDKFTNEEHYQNSITSKGKPGEKIPPLYGAGTLHDKIPLPTVYPETNTLYKVFINKPRDQKKNKGLLILGTLFVAGSLIGLMSHKEKWINNKGRRLIL